MNVVIIGVTGLLGSEAANQLVARGHKVWGLALPSLPEGLVLLPEVKIVYGNYITGDDVFLNQLFINMDAFIFASGIDERIEIPVPAFETFNKYNVDPLKRIFNFAKANGVKHSIILGSYFTHFVLTRPELELTKHHPYIRSRELQKKMALSEANDEFSVAVLELPYIFGSQQGRKPVWAFLVKMLINMKVATFFPKGGTTMVTVHQVGQVSCGALEITKDGKIYQIGYYNLTWRELFKVFHKYMGVPNKLIITIPKFMFKIAAKKIMKEQGKRGIEGGLNLPEFVKMQCSNQFIDPNIAAIGLGVTADDIDRAIGDSVTQSLVVLKGNSRNVEMKL